ncbi:hypothetical protein Tco_0533724 [Tanacetum coccineum]
MGFITGSALKSDYVAEVICKFEISGIDSNAETYDRIDGSIVFTLLQKINSFKQGGLPVSEYYHKLNSLWREFDILTKLPDCVCEARAELIDHGKLMRLMQFLMGLDDVYQPIRSSLLTREILPEVRDAFLIIAREESHRGISSSSVKTEKPQASVFVARTNDNNRNNNSNWNNGNSSGNGNRGNYNNLLCKNCGLKGHTVERCFEIIGYPPGFKRNPNLKVSNNFNNNKNNNADVKTSLVGNNEIRTSTGTLSFTNEQVQKLMSLLNDKSGSAAHANMAGNLKLNNDVVLFDVLVIPEYCVSLLSVHKLIKDSKLSVSFDETKCVIQDLKREKVLGTGSESVGLYVFDANCDKLAASNQSDLIHLDVWGPYKVVSREGFRLPSSVLNGKSPFSLRASTVSDFESHLDMVMQFLCKHLYNDENSSEGYGGSHLEVPIFENVNQSETEEVSPDNRMSSRPSKLQAN